MSSFPPLARAQLRVILLGFVLLTCIPVLREVLPSEVEASTSHEKSAVNAGTVLSLSDIHFDPFYGLAFSGVPDSDLKQLILGLITHEAKDWDEYLAKSPIQSTQFSQQQAHHAMGHFDSNYKLLQTALDYSACVSPNPDFIVITGDFLAHNYPSGYDKVVNALRMDAHNGKIKDPALAKFVLGLNPSSVDRREYQEFVKKTMVYVASSIARRFPSTQIYAALGNNDSYTGDYQVNSDGAYFRDMAKVWKTYFLPGMTPAESASFDKTFQEGGYFAAALPHPAQGQAFVLSTSYFSVKNYQPNTPQGANQQLNKWLVPEVGKLGSGVGAWLMGHIPPGRDGYGGHDSWNDPYHKSFVQMVSNQQGKVKTQLFGHTHMQEFKLYQESSQVSYDYLHVSPGITPINGNNSGFQVLSYDRSTLELLDYTTFYLDNRKANQADQTAYQAGQDCTTILNENRNRKAWRQAGQKFRDAYPSANKNLPLVDLMNDAYSELSVKNQTYQDEYSDRYMVYRGKYHGPNWKSYGSHPAPYLPAMVIADQAQGE